MVYVVVTDGVQITLAAVFVFKYIFGDQVYVLAPLAVNVLADNGQTVIFGETVITGKGLTVMIADELVFVQPFPSV